MLSTKEREELLNRGIHVDDDDKQHRFEQMTIRYIKNVLDHPNLQHINMRPLELELKRRMRERARKSARTTLKRACGILEAKSSKRAQRAYRALSDYLDHLT